ncbi:dipeptidase PepV [Pradoshia eiseniae]|uniref:Dipeptidase PepV n=1 Tax=Pradoshia eiseniae TaxID=2064768 RepID=A0A2S7MXV6_9BACI|nr:dipeptidase PepV [Pradoshia eiseniae]PQD94585.1 dipeptidase PepV [Pradoshia eiseniae]
MQINWQKEVEQRKEQLIKDTQRLLQIKSTLDEETATEEIPFGKGIKEALDFMLDLGEKDGFSVKNVDNYGAHLEMGHGEELLGILGHLDVVPEGEGWTTDPYSADIRDGRIYARGAMDDKGPTMAAYYAMKIVKDLGVDVNKRVRLILGTDEESDWRCMDHYFEKEETPTVGFVPDADFPIIYAEKGIADFTYEFNGSVHEGAEATLLSFSAGQRFNMVPEFAEAVVTSDSVEAGQWEERYSRYCEDHGLSGTFSAKEGTVTFTMDGISVHGMEPDLGVNAGLRLAEFLVTLPFIGDDERFLSFISQFCKESRGRELGVAYSDDITKDLTINYGILSYEHGGKGKIAFNMRYPVTFDFANGWSVLEKVASDHGFSIQMKTHLGPHHVDADSDLVKTLQKIYEEHTGQEAELLAIGGGTYARAIKNAVAFGPLFPGREDVAHQKDEYIIIEDMLKATAMYAQAIYDLTR